MSKPQQVVSFSGGKALVESEGETREVRSPIPLEKGEWVLCQAGFVAKRIPGSKALEMLKEWRELNDF